MQLKNRRGHQSPHRSNATPLHEGKIALLAEKMRSANTLQKLEAILDISTEHERGLISRDDARSILAKALGDEDRQVRWSAVYALGQMDALIELNEGLKNSCHFVRSMSAAMIYSSLRRTGASNTGFRPNELMEKIARSLAANLGSNEPSVARFSTSALSLVARRAPIAAITVVEEAKEHLGIENELDERLRIVEKVALQSLKNAAGQNRA